MRTTSRPSWPRRAAHERGLPRYVERELRAYLACGIHAHGFLRARCVGCGKELLVAFSCKRRGVCPSCNARRMCGTAAHLTDRVLPDVPVRQWVLSVPFELRLLLARNAAALSAVGRIFVQQILRWQREQTRADLGGRDSILRSPSIRGGAICFPQRFGGSLNLNVHYHVAVPDGVFVRASSDAEVSFQQLPMPNRPDLEAIGHGIEIRVVRWLRRRRLLGEEEANEAPRDAARQGDALDACLQGSLGIGDLAALPGTAAGEAHLAALSAASPRARRRTQSSRGFDIHAAVSVSAHDREGRERLLRYCARAPLSLERLSLLDDGRVAYRIKNPRGQQTHCVMTPTQFLARLSALIPPPRHPLVRFHGVFAPHSSWRPHVVALANGGPATKQELTPKACQSVASRHRDTRAPTVLRGAHDDADDATLNHAAIRDSRIDWATLLRRIHDIDALACPCGGRLRVIALITEPGVASAILTALWLPAAAPPIARARSPDYCDLPTG